MPMDATVLDGVGQLICFVRKTGSGSGFCIQAVLGDICGNCVRKPIRAAFSRSQSTANIGRGDIFVHRLHQMHSGPLLWRELQHCKIVQRRSRSAHNNPLGQIEQAIRPMPLPQSKKAVCAGDGEELCLGILFAQYLKRIGRVIQRAVRVWCVDLGCFESCVGLACQPHHGEPVVKRSSTIGDLERLSSYWSEKDLIEPEGIGCSARYLEVAAMRRIERPSEEGQPFESVTDYHSRRAIPVEKMFAFTGPVVPL